MSNPWEEIKLSDYEGHMNLESVNQLPVLRSILKEQLETPDIQNGMILGIAGGAGLEDVKQGQLNKLYGLDINKDFLMKCKARFGHLEPMLELVNIDLMREDCNLPKTDLLICNLVAEYIGYDALLRSVLKSQAKVASVVIQLNKQHNFVSDSPYLKNFQRLDEVHCLMEEEVLIKKFVQIDFVKKSKKTWELPNGKQLIRLEFVQR